MSIQQDQGLEPINWRYFWCKARAVTTPPPRGNNFRFLSIDLIGYILCPAVCCSHQIFQQHSLFFSGRSVTFLSVYPLKKSRKTFKGLRHPQHILFVSWESVCWVSAVSGCCVKCVEKKNRFHLLNFPSSGEHTFPPGCLWPVIFHISPSASPSLCSVTALFSAAVFYFDSLFFFFFFFLLVSSF